MGLHKTEVLGAVFNCVAVEGARKTEHEHTLEVWIGNGTGWSIRGRGEGYQVAGGQAKRESDIYPSVCQQLRHRLPWVWGSWGSGKSEEKFPPDEHPSLCKVRVCWS